MDGPQGHPTPERRLRTLLRHQHGVVSRNQLRRLDLGDDAIDARVRKGVLLRVERGVYTVGHDRLTDEGRWMAAVLRHGEGTVLSHLSAGALWGVVRRGSKLIDVTVPRHTGRKSRGPITVHRTVCLSGAELTTKSAIPVTTPARTLLDMAELVDRRTLERAVDDAARLRLCKVGALRATIERNWGRVGGTRLAALLDEHAIGTTATANDFEERFLALCDEVALPRPEVNVRLGPYKVDFLWRAQRMIVETDGRPTHGTPLAFEADRARDVELSACGWMVLRFTWRQLTQEPGWVARKVLEALGASGA